MLTLKLAPAKVNSFLKLFNFCGRSVLTLTFSGYPNVSFS